MYSWIAKLVMDPVYARRMRRWAWFLPRSIALMICRLAGTGLYYGNVPMRNRIESNMRDMFRHESMHRVRRLCRSHLRHVVMMAYEILSASKFLNSRVRRTFQVQGEAFLEAALNLGRGAIVCSVHIGNFLYYYSYLSRKYPCLVIVTEEYEVLRALYQTLQRPGCQLLHYDSTSPATLAQTISRHLDANGIVLLFGDDRHPSLPLSEFFARHTPVTRQIVKIALNHQVPVVPFCGRRLKGFVHHLVFGPPMCLYRAYKRSQASEATRELSEMLQQMIEHTPDQWLYWPALHERWHTRQSQPEAKTADGLSHPEARTDLSMYHMWLTGPYLDC